MSGTVWFHKALLTDPRFMRMVKATVKELSNAPAFRGVTQVETYQTLVLGGLMKLWIYADVHIRDGNTLDLSTDEIDELIGIAGFCKLMPVDWLVVLDANSVELPDYLEHNGTVARKKALNANRQERYRNKHKADKSNAQASRAVTHVTHGASPSHPVPSLPIPGKKAPTKTKTPAPESARRQAPLSDDSYWQEFQSLQELYPPGTYRAVAWQGAERNFRLLRETEPIETLVKAVQSYAAQQEAMGKVGSQFILSPERFFSGNNWRGPFALPTATASDAAKPSAEALEVWDKVVTSQGEHRTPRITLALAAIGGYQRIRLRTDATTSTIRREFCEAYERAAGDKAA